MTKQEEIYVPLLNNYCSLYKDWLIGVGKPNFYVDDLYGLFLVNTGEKYPLTTPKIFYVGKETKGWYPNFQEMVELCANNKTEDYIKKQNEWLLQDKFYEEIKNPFWKLVIKLHIYIHTNELLTDIKKINNKQKDLLHSIGWGNINSMITPQGLGQYGKIVEDDVNIWKDIDKEVYNYIKKSSHMFDKMKLLLDIYNPDVIFIFNENENEEKYYEQYLEGLKITGCPETKMYDDFLVSYSIEGYTTKIIWTKHPRYLLKIGVYIEDIKNAYDIITQKKGK